MRAFWCSKWVIRGIFGKLKKSTFQRYQVYTNRSSVGKAMAPGSKGVRAVFFIFSVKIPAKPEMLLANQELHVVAGVSLFLNVPNLRINS